MKASTVKQLFIAFITFKTDAVNLQSNKTSFKAVFTTH